MKSSKSKEQVGRRPSASNTRQSNQALPSGVSDVLALYQQHANELRFPGVDFEVLSHHVGDLEQADQVVQQAQQQLAAANAKRQAAQQVLEGAAKQALAYAQVFAEQHPELASEVQSLTLKIRERPQRARAGRGRSNTSPSESAAPATASRSEAQRTNGTLEPVQREVA